MRLKLIIIIPAIFFFNALYSQDITKLDERNGFKNLLLETSLKIIEKSEKLKYIEADKAKKISAYSIKDLSKYTIYGVEPSLIYLFFFNEKLMRISIKMPDQPTNFNGVINKAHFNLSNNIYQELLDTYGRKIETSKNNLDGSKSTVWKGDKVTLYWIKYELLAGESSIVEPGFRLEFISNNLYSENQLFNNIRNKDF